MGIACLIGRYLVEPAIERSSKHRRKSTPPNLNHTRLPTPSHPIRCHREIAAGEIRGASHCLKCRNYELADQACTLYSSASRMRSAVTEQQIRDNRIQDPGGKS